MDSDFKSVRSLFGALIDAWNERDATAMAALYAPSGSQVGFDGSALNSPAEIEQHLAPIFRDHPTARFVTIVREVRAVGQRAALLRAVAGMIPPGEGEVKADRNAIQTMVASCSVAGEWQVEMFQNTPAALDGRDQERKALTLELQKAADAS